MNSLCHKSISWAYLVSFFSSMSYKSGDLFCSAGAADNIRPDLCGHREPQISYSVICFQTFMSLLFLSTAPSSHFAPPLLFTCSINSLPCLSFAASTSLWMFSLGKPGRPRQQYSLLFTPLSSGNGWVSLALSILHPSSCSKHDALQGYIYKAGSHAQAWEHLVK